jgi:hypothetical protein
VNKGGNATTGRKILPNEHKRIPMLPREERLQAFLSRYGEALSAGDLPALVLSDEGSIPVATRAEVEEAFRDAAQSYRAQGLVAARTPIIGSQEITEPLASVDVRLAYLDEQGEAYRYLVRLEEEAVPRIQVVTGR